MSKRLILASAIVAPTVALAAGAPGTLGRFTGGLWELNGVPGTHAPVRRCLPDKMVLAQYEHRGRHCPSTLVSDDGGSAVISYDCGAAGFGHTQIVVLTPRSLRISTQGISNRMPFGYTLQAHRVGECASASPQH